MCISLYFPDSIHILTLLIAPLWKSNLQKKTRKIQKTRDWKNSKISKIYYPAQKDSSEEDEGKGGAARTRSKHNRPCKRSKAYMNEDEENDDEDGGSIEERDGRGGRGGGKRKKD